MSATVPARLLMGPVKAYRVVSTRLPSQCRYHPSCSQYALDALRLHGGRRGTWLAVKRVGRCHPWGGGGLDPVPQPEITNVRSVPAEIR
jgi:putative membrane protein insertion efficiency factor